MRRKAHCSPCAFLSPFPSVLSCCEELLQICCAVCAAFSPSCQKHNLCLSSCWQRWIFGKLRRTCVWEGKKVYGPVLSWDSSWKSWECFDYCSKLLEACEGGGGRNLYSLPKLPTSYNLFLKESLLYRATSCFQTLQPSKACSFSCPRALHSSIPEAWCKLVVMLFFWRRFISWEALSWQTKGSQPDPLCQCPCPGCCFPATDSLLFQQHLAWVTDVSLQYLPTPSPLPALSHFINNAASGGGHFKGSCKSCFLSQ